MRLQKSGEQLLLYVPNELINFFGWKKGDFFYPIPTDHGIEFVKMENKKNQYVEVDKKPTKRQKQEIPKFDYSCLLEEYSDDNIEG